MVVNYVLKFNSEDIKVINVALNEQLLCGCEHELPTKQVTLSILSASRIFMETGLKFDQSTYINMLELLYHDKII